MYSVSCSSLVALLCVITHSGRTRQLLEFLYLYIDRVARGPDWSVAEKDLELFILLGLHRRH